MEHPLRIFREQRGLSLEALAQRVGVAKSSLSRVENGEQKPSFGLIQRLCAETGLPPGAFFETADNAENAA